MPLAVARGPRAGPHRAHPRRHAVTPPSSSESDCEPPAASAAARGPPGPPCTLAAGFKFGMGFGWLPA